MSSTSRRISCLATRSLHTTFCVKSGSAAAVACCALDADGPTHPIAAADELKLDGCVLYAGCIGRLGRFGNQVVRLSIVHRAHCR
eukprot:202325-Pleurochrysis_carterae.AAC.9